MLRSRTNFSPQFDSRLRRTTPSLDIASPDAAKRSASLRA